MAIFVVIILIVSLAKGSCLTADNSLELESKLESVNLSLSVDKENSGSQGNYFIKIEERTVKGNSLSGILEDGETAKILFGYYDSHKIDREDVVVYSYAPNKTPIIKIVKAIAGDRFSLRKAGHNSGWNILVNGRMITNSKAQPYLLTGKRYRMLSLYQKSYNGVIPQDCCLILGNIASGTMDSSRFGLVHKSDILGKVEIN